MRHTLGTALMGEQSDGAAHMGFIPSRNSLPVMGLAVAVVLNAAWIGFLEYELFNCQGSSESWEGAFGHHPFCRPCFA